MNRVVTARNIAPVTTSEVAYLTGKDGLKGMISRAFEFSGEPLGADLLEELFVASVEDYGQNILVDTVLYPGVRASLERFLAILNFRLKIMTPTV